MDNESENQSFSEFLRERMKERGWNAKRLSEVSGVSLKHVEGLLRGNMGSLPSTPYVHGYLERLGQIFGFDVDEWWEKLKTGGEISDSGASDRLPKNRFLKKTHSKLVWLGALAALIIIYAALRFAPVLGRPNLDIAFPNSNFLTVASSELTLNGQARNADALTVDGEAVSIAPDGSWTKQVALQPGLNTIEVTAKKFLGGEVSLTRQILYQPASSTPTATQ